MTVVAGRRPPSRIGTYPAPIARRRDTTSATALALVAGAALLAAPVAESKGRPAPRDLRCLSSCAGLRAATEAGKVALSGRRLENVSEVRFPGPSSPISVSPDRAEATKLVVTVPTDADSGKLRALKPNGDKGTSAERLRVAAPSEVPNHFRLASARLSDHNVFFDQAAPIRLRYRFEAGERTGVRVEIVRAEDKRVIRTYRRRGQLPFSEHSLVWNGLEGDGDAARDGTYRLRVGAFGEDSRVADKLKLHTYRFPVRGGHSYGGSGERFGAPRSGGRVHEGQDVFAGCGTPLEAARGGEVQAKGYDPVLLGNYVSIDIRASSTDHLYVHLASPARPGKGDRVHTGERIGSVGNSGNARSEPCQLHFEMWPNGWHNGSPVDPYGALKHWDAYS